MRLEMPRKVKAKKTCCKDQPRCKKCPVVLKRLEAVGFAERVDRRTYLVVDVIPKQELKAVRRPKVKVAR